MPRPAAGYADEMRDVAFAAIGGLALLLAPVSARIRELPVSEPLAALLLGVALGPEGLGALDVAAADEVPLVEVVAEVVLALSLMALALRFPAGALIERVRPLAVATGVGMIGMAAVSSGLAWLVLGVPAGIALVLGCALAPTDPVLAASVVEGEPAERDIREHVRVLLTGESGFNDVLAFPFVVVATAAVVGTSVGTEAAVAAGQVTLGLVIGVPAGWVAARFVSSAAAHRQVEHSAFLVVTLALAIAVLGLVNLVDGEGILAVLAAGLAYNHGINRHEREEEWEVEEAISRYLVLPVFALLGVILPWSVWSELGWRLPALVVAVLLLRRLPLLLALGPSIGVRPAESAFLGWFGPIGVASLFYLSRAHAEGGIGDTVWAAGVVVVATSTVLHGVTSSPGRRLLRRMSPS